MGDGEEDDEELIRYHEIATMRQQRKTSQSAKKPHTGASKPNQPVRRGVSMAGSLHPLRQMQHQQGLHPRGAAALKGIPGQAAIHPKARLNLESKLNLVAATESANHPAPPSNASPHNYSFEFKELADNEADQGFESFVSAHQAHHGNSINNGQKPINIHPVRHLAAGTSNTFCDSGLGTPSSLIGGDASEPRSSSSSSSSFIGHSLSRWKSSVSGLVTGFICCGGGGGAARREHYTASTPTFEFQHQVAVASGQGARQEGVTSVEPISAPSTHGTSSSHSHGTSSSEHSASRRKWSAASGVGCSGSSSTSGVSSHESRLSPEETKATRGNPRTRSEACDANQDDSALCASANDATANVFGAAQNAFSATRRDAKDRRRGHGRGSKRNDSVEAEADETATRASSAASSATTGSSSSQTSSLSNGSRSINMNSTVNENCQKGNKNKLSAYRPPFALAHSAGGNHYFHPAIHI